MFFASCTTKGTSRTAVGTVVATLQHMAVSNNKHNSAFQPSQTPTATVDSEKDSEEDSGEDSEEDSEEVDALLPW